MSFVTPSPFAGTPARPSPRWASFGLLLFDGSLYLGRHIRRNRGNAVRRLGVLRALGHDFRDVLALHDEVTAGHHVTALQDFRHQMSPSVCSAIPFATHRGPDDFPTPTGRGSFPLGPQFDPQTRYADAASCPASRIVSTWSPARTVADQLMAMASLTL